MRTATSDFAVLGMLSLGPMTGYEIRQGIKESIAQFWNESFGQIYPTLKRLTAEGLIVAAAASRRDRPGACKYKLAAAGKERLRQWLMERPIATTPRNQLLLKMFFGREMPLSSARKHLTDWRDSQQRAIQALSAIQTRVHSDRDNAAAPFWQITLNHGFERARAEIKWCEQSLKLLEELPAAAPRKRATSKSGKSRS